MRQGKIRRDAGDMLVTAMLDHGAGGACVRRTGTRWASATFSGMRHAVVLHFTGADAVAQGRALAAGLDVYEFTLHGHIVADICVVRREERGGELVLEIEALTVEDV